MSHLLLSPDAQFSDESRWAADLYEVPVEVAEIAEYDRGSCSCAGYGTLLYGNARLAELEFGLIDRSVDEKAEIRRARSRSGRFPGVLN